MSVGQAARPRRAARRPIALVVGMLACAGLGLGGGRIVQGWDGVPYVMGYSLTLSILAWCAVKIADRESGWRSYFLLYAASLAAGLAMLPYQTAQAKLADRGLKSTLTELRAGLPFVTSRPIAGGEMGRIEQFGREFLITEARDGRAYGAELAALQFDRILAPAALARPEGLQLARDRLETAADIVDKYHLLAGRRYQAMIAKAEALPIDPALRARLVAGLRQGAETARARSERQWEIQRDIVDERQQMTDLLFRADWKVRRGRVAFASPQDLAEYDRHVGEVRRLLLEGLAIQAWFDRQVGGARPPGPVQPDHKRAA